MTLDDMKRHDDRVARSQLVALAFAVLGVLGGVVLLNLPAPQPVVGALSFVVAGLSFSLFVALCFAYVLPAED